MPLSGAHQGMVGVLFLIGGSSPRSWIFPAAASVKSSQRVSHEAKLGFLAPCLAIKLRLAFRVSPQRFRHSDSYLYSGAAFS